VTTHSSWPVIPFFGMTVRILCQGDGAISRRHYKTKPPIVTRRLHFLCASVCEAAPSQMKCGGIRFQHNRQANRQFLMAP